MHSRGVARSSAADAGKIRTSPGGANCRLAGNADRGNMAGEFLCVSCQL